MSLSVFRKGNWIQYDVPETGTSIWTTRQKLQAASVYATAICNGFSQERSVVLAECFMNKQLYGVTYSKQLEKELQSLLV
jgi:hypothetical protein